MYQFFSSYYRCCCCHWVMVGNHCDALSRDDMMWLVLVLWLLLSSSLSILFLWLWLVKNFVSYQHRRFHHRNTHTRSPGQIAYQTMPMPALMLMMIMVMPNLVYIECIGMIHQNGQCLWLALEMTQKLCFSARRHNDVDDRPKKMHTKPKKNRRERKKKFKCVIIFNININNKKNEREKN